MAFFFFFLVICNDLQLINFYNLLKNFRMFNCFLSQENITKLICSNKDLLPLKYISKLVNDFSNLLNESDFYDVEIKVGENENVRTFRAHSIILKARSSYFKAALSDNWIKKSEDNDNIILFEKKNISPKIFEVLLT